MQTKPWWKSRTAWAAIILVAINILSMEPLRALLSPEIVAWLSVVIGSLVIVFRTVAQGPLTLSTPPQPPVSLTADPEHPAS